MNYRLILKTTGRVLILEAAAMLPSLICSLLYKESIMPFAVSIAVLIAIGSSIAHIKCTHNHFYSKDGFVCVSLIWFALSLFGALPFYLCGHFESYIDCFFEASSGFTTTGASVLTAVEELPKGILFWRSFTHFIGGMGILVLANALLPSGKDRSQHLMRAEVPGPTSDKLVPKLSDSSKILYIIYTALTVLETVILTFFGLDLFHSLTISFGTAGTGGFAVMNASIGAYGNPAIEWVVGIFMLLFSINFAVHFLLITGRFKQVFKNEELRVYLAAVFFSVAVVTINVVDSCASITEALRLSFFNVASIVSTTGFCNTDTNLWPQLSKTVLILLMFMGAMAGSTGGGIKCARVTMSVKSVSKEIKQIIHPNSVKIVMMDGKRVDSTTMTSVLRFFVGYILIILAAVFLVSFDGYDFETTFTSVLSAISNIGPGFGLVGATGNFSMFSAFNKVILSLCMIIGRLEIFPVLIFFSPSTWKKA